MDSEHDDGLAELSGQLQAFARHHLDDPAATVASLTAAPGHAGFAYLFDIASQGGLLRYWMRLPPPNVKHEGTADVLRQVAVLNALEGTDVPHCPVVWSGDDPRWFGRPYFVVERIEGDVMRDEWLEHFTADQRWDVARQAMSALARVHRVPEDAAPYLGEFWGFEFDITRWDRFYERAEEKERLALQPRVRQLLLDSIPGDANIAIYHGDFQWANVMVDGDARLRAIIDWELCGIGATLNDVGWISSFNEPEPWGERGLRTQGLMPQGAELEEMYAEAWGAPLEHIRWFKALAVYKFGIISGFNLMLHRRGKRHDPLWEEIAVGMQPNMEYALKMLTS